MTLSFAVKCSVCKSISDTYDPYLGLVLAIRVLQQGRGWGGALLLLGLYLSSALGCKSSCPHNGQWYQMDDGLVRSSDVKVVLNQQAYVLFYLR